MSCLVSELQTVRKHNLGHNFHGLGYWQWPRVPASSVFPYTSASQFLLPTYFRLRTQEYLRRRRGLRGQESQLTMRVLLEVITSRRGDATRAILLSERFQQRQATAMTVIMIKLTTKEMLAMGVHETSMQSDVDRGRPADATSLIVIPMIMSLQSCYSM